MLMNPHHSMKVANMTSHRNSHSIVWQYHSFAIHLFVIKVLNGLDFKCWFYGQQKCFLSGLERRPVRLRLLPALARWIRTSEAGLRSQRLWGHPGRIRIPERSRSRNWRQHSCILHLRAESCDQEGPLLHRNNTYFFYIFSHKVVGSNPALGVRWNKKEQKNTWEDAQYLFDIN